MNTNDYAAGTVTIMDAAGRVVDQVPPEHFYQRQAAEVHRNDTTMTTAERGELGRKASAARWRRKPKRSVTS